MGGSIAGGELVLARESAPALRGLGALARRARDHGACDGEGIQKWLDYEHEALRLGLDPDRVPLDGHGRVPGGYLGAGDGPGLEGGAKEAA